MLWNVSVGKVKVRCRKEEGMVQEQEQIVGVVIGRVRGCASTTLVCGDTQWEYHGHALCTSLLTCIWTAKGKAALRALTAYPGQPVFCPGTLLTSLAIASHIPDYANVRSGGLRGVCACVVWVRTSSSLTSSSYFTFTNLSGQSVRSNNL